eukprot:1832258-Pyramimonas_sp.AAC.1
MENPSTDRCTHCHCIGLSPAQAPESTAKKAFDFDSTVDRRRLSTLVYHFSAQHFEYSTEKS